MTVDRDGDRDSGRHESPKLWRRLEADADGCGDVNGEGWAGMAAPERGAAVRRSDCGAAHMRRGRAQVPCPPCAWARQHGAGRASRSGGAGMRGGLPSAARARPCNRAQAASTRRVLTRVRHAQRLHAQSSSLHELAHRRRRGELCGREWRDQGGESDREGGAEASQSDASGDNTVRKRAGDRSGEERCA